MKTIHKIILIFLLILPLFGIAETKEIPFTLDDRDGIIRTEQKVESVKTEMKNRFEASDKQIAGLRSEMAARFDQLFNFTSRVECRDVLDATLFWACCYGIPAISVSWRAVFG